MAIMGLAAVGFLVCLAAPMSSTAPFLPPNFMQGFNDQFNQQMRFLQQSIAEGQRRFQEQMRQSMANLHAQLDRDIFQPIKQAVQELRQEQPDLFPAGSPFDYTFEQRRVITDAVKEKLGSRVTIGGVLEPGLLV